MLENILQPKKILNVIGGKQGKMTIDFKINCG